MSERIPIPFVDPDEHARRVREAAAVPPRTRTAESSPSTDTRQDDAERITLAQYLARGHNDRLVRFTTGTVHLVLETGCVDDGRFETLCRSVTRMPTAFRGSDFVCWRCLREARS